MMRGRAHACAREEWPAEVPGTAPSCARSALLLDDAGYRPLCLRPASLRPRARPRTQIVSKPLVIVESPAKARTIGKFLGTGFTVKASMGHVRDLPRSGLHVYPEKRFDADWEPIQERTKVVSELRRA